uniref:Transglutaminase-like domain-containing protein n=1 Tax=Clastoptera arizonana TaxID=38151 RepID=A0A1B6D4M4_9HEMI
MTALEVEFLHFYPPENAKEHHTERFEVVHNDPPNPVLRRGQEFYLAIRFNHRGYRDDVDIVRLVFSYGDYPNPIKGTSGVALLTGREIYTGDRTQWDVRVKGCDGTILTVEVLSPVNAPVGAWKLKIETSLTTSQSGDFRTYDYSEPIFLLFNPWLKADTVYMPDELQLGEYILNDIGKIWVGPMGSCRGREWVFGQFDAIVLPAIMMVLERTKLPGEVFADPIRITRALSKLVNSNDDQGILRGRWDGEYDDGTAPAAWTGSVPILEQYLNSGVEVLYGQCWVFAGVLTTICRALGIPSRVVSNLVSAHDANASLTVDRYYSSANEELPFDPHNPEGGEDSIWNYHVWNDVWMSRPDLPIGYGGWQAVDATPQETSDGVYQCGPSSLEAIRRGQVGLRYDVPFLLASVNADLIRWKQDASSVLGYTKMDCNKYHIGRQILTKQPFIFDPQGDTDKEDITYSYKSEEGTETERLTLYNAVQGTARAKRFYDLPDAATSQVSFELKELDKVNLGQNFAIAVELKNQSNEVKRIQAALSASSIFYNGVKAHLIKRETGVFVLQPYQVENLRLIIKPEEYIDKLVEYCIIKIFAMMTVMETRQSWAGEDDFQITKPTLNIYVPKNAVVGLSTKMSFQFKNPLKKTLTNCSFLFECPGITKNTKLSYRNVGPEEEARIEHLFTPIQSGEFKVIATFKSKELIDITGNDTIEIFE